MSDGPISQQEMIEMFGEAMPIEAVNLLANSADHMIVSELRRKLREIAATRTEPSTITEEGLVERLTKVIDDCHDWQATPREIAERVIAASGHTALLSQIADDDVKAAAKQMRAVLDDGYDDETALFSALEMLGLTRAALSRPLP